MNFDWDFLTSNGLKGLVILVIVMLIIPALPKLPGLTKAGIDWVVAQAKKVHNEYASGVLQRLSTMAGALVLAYENTEIEKLKEKAAKGEITWDALPLLLKQLKADLMAQLQSHSTASGLWSAALTLFAGNEEALKKWVDSVVEAHVSQLPASNLQTGPSPAMAAAPPAKAVASPT